jgi:alpha-mannosidase
MARPLTFYVVPHTHWDREWYRPLEHFRLALGEVVDGVLDVLERDPSFTSFTLDGQAIALEDYLDARPGHEHRLRRQIDAGRIEVGPSYMLPDEFLVGGEPLVRNLLLGRAVCRRFGAEPSPAGYLPDSFGHPLQIPQILAGFGIRTFIFSRGLGDELDSHGVAFRWRAPDGSEVLALQQILDYSNFAHPSGVDDAERSARGVAQFAADHDQAGLADRVLLCNGTDHEPVMAELPELCAELERRIANSTFTISTYGEYAAAVGQPGPAADTPVLTGELLGGRLQNVLRGVNSARTYVKVANERAEQRLLAVETVAALRALSTDTPFPVDDFAVAWKELLRCQPHDTICGCSCDEVHVDALARYGSLHRTLDWLERRGARPDDGAALSAVNPLPFRRRVVVERSGFEPAIVELDGFGAGTVELEPETPGPETPVPGPGTGTAIENDRFRVEAAPDGTVTVRDKREGRTFERLHALEDEPDVGDLYTFCPDPEATVWRQRGPATTRVLRTGRPPFSELELTVEHEGFTATTVVRLIDGADRIEFRTTVDNRAPDHRLRVVFDTGTADPTAPVRAEGQFAVVHRPRVPAPPETEWVEPPAPTGHTCGAVAVGGLAVISRGLPEYEARTGDLAVTLLRCVGLISRLAGLPTRPRCAGPQTEAPGGQCLGRHEFEYALLPSAGELSDLDLIRASQDYRAALITTPAASPNPPPLTLTGDATFSSLKGAEDGDGLILRLFNPSTTTSARAHVSGEFETITRTRLDETGDDEVHAGQIDLAPGQIATLRLT